MLAARLRFSRGWHVLTAAVFFVTSPLFILFGPCGVAVALAAWVAAALELNAARKLWRPEQSRLYRELAGGQGTVGWAYRAKSARHRFIPLFSWVELHFRDGEKLEVRAGEADAADILSLVGERCPGVLLGYGAQQREAWRRLRR